jgi:hypothetical protein
MPHLFVDVSSHGYGHLSQAAPVLNRLAELVHGLHLTVRSGLPAARLAQRIHVPFVHRDEASDFGYMMIDALSIDRSASADAYRAAHADFPARIAAEAAGLQGIAVDAMFADVAYLPLAGAALAGIPAVALCSLNWADLFAHYFGAEDWAAAIHAEMLAAYRTATFLRTTPGMPMPALADQIVIGPVAGLGRQRRDELRKNIGAGGTARLALVALGGIPTRLPVETWPALPDTHWLVPEAWQTARADCHAIERLDWPFVDLLRSVDAIITKPGYGAFAEAACNGTAVIYQRRENWPEQDYLIDWLHANARHAEVSAADLASGNLGAALAACLQAAIPPTPTPDGVETAARHLAALLTRPD